MKVIFSGKGGCCFATETGKFCRDIALDARRNGIANGGALYE